LEEEVSFSTIVFFQRWGMLRVKLSMDVKIKFIAIRSLNALEEEGSFSPIVFF
jgi:hypothetical protein